MSKHIEHRKRILEHQKRRRHGKFMYYMKPCRYEGCNAYNGPNALYCHKCGKRLYGPPENNEESLCR